MGTRNHLIFQNSNLLNVKKCTYSSVCFMLALLLILSSCAKDDGDSVDGLPIFGTCEAVATKGRLSQSASGGMLTYTTNAGDTITIDGYTITIWHKDNPQFKIQFWGEGHENLNGKHIKDWELERRSFVFPDGTKITMISNSSKEVFSSVTIYDGQECHHINTRCNPSSNSNSRTLEYSSASSSFTKRLDDAEADGETGTFEITSTSFLFYNIYTELTPGQKDEKHVPLGEVFKDDPSHIYDYYPSPH